MMKNKDWKGIHDSGGGAVYTFGLFGALIYFISHAQTLGQGLLGVLKAFVWPAFLIYKLFAFLKL